MIGAGSAWPTLVAAPLGSPVGVAGGASGRLSTVAARSAGPDIVGGGTTGGDMTGDSGDATTAAASP
ncbi:MAG: hypothetical protein U1E17_06380 [Geminicoccaceae bacterium]